MPLDFYCVFPTAAAESRKRGLPRAEAVSVFSAHGDGRGTGGWDSDREKGIENGPVTIEEISSEGDGWQRQKVR